MASENGFRWLFRKILFFFPGTQLHEKIFNTYFATKKVIFLFDVKRSLILKGGRTPKKQFFVVFWKNKIILSLKTWLNKKIISSTFAMEKVRFIFLSYDDPVPSEVVAPPKTVLSENVAFSGKIDKWKNSIRFISNKKRLHLNLAWNAAVLQKM